MDMNDGKIPPNKVSEQTEKYVVELTRQKKGDIVTAERINARPLCFLLKSSICNVDIVLFPFKN